MKAIYTQEDFVRAYITSFKNGISFQDLCEKMQLSASAVLQRANRLRTKGVKLPQLRGEGLSNNIRSAEELNKLIEDLS